MFHLSKLAVNIIAFLFTIILVVVIIPPQVIFILPLLLYRLVVIQLAKIFKQGTLAKIVSSRSSLMFAESLYAHPKNSLLSIFLLEGIVDLHQLRHIFLTKAVHLRDPQTGDLRYPELQQNVTGWMGLHFWRNLEHFDLQELIREYKYDDPEILDNTTAQNIIKTLLFQPFSKDKPLWEILVLPNYKPDPTKCPGVSVNKKYSALVFRIHHGLADGFSLLRLLQAISTSGDKFKFIETTDYTQKSKIQNKPTFISQLVKCISLTVRMPFEMSVKAAEKLLQVESWKKLKQRNRRLCLSTTNKTHKIDKPSKYFANYVCSSSPNISLSEIKDIKLAHGVSGTAVLYAAIVGAVRNCVFQEQETIPEKLFVFGPLPIPRCSDKLRNAVTLGWMTAPLREDDAVKRLHAMHKVLEAQKRSTLPLLFALWSKVGGSFPYFISRMGATVLTNIDSICISNVAGPKDEHDFAGYPIKELVVAAGSWAECNSIAISLISTGGKIRVSIGADKRLLLSDEKAKDFTDRFLTELDILKKPANFEVV